MQQAELKSPFGTVNMYKNGQRINFEVEPFSYGMYLKNDNTFKEPQGLYKLYPDMEELESGDIIICEFDRGHLQGDGGDEFMMNIVGTYQGYTIGMGAPDSQDIEEHYTIGERVLPYETWGSTERGFEIHIVDTPEKYLCDKDFQKLCFVVAFSQPFFASTPCGLSPQTDGMPVILKDRLPTVSGKRSKAIFPVLLARYE